MDISCRQFLCPPNVFNSSDNQARPTVDHYVELQQLCSFAYASKSWLKMLQPSVICINRIWNFKETGVSNNRTFFFIHTCAFKHNTCIPTKNYHTDLYTNEWTWRLQIYENINCIYRCVLLLLLDMSTNCACKLKLPSFSIPDNHFFTGIGDFKLCSNIHNSVTQNNGLLLYTDLPIHSSSPPKKRESIQVPNYT